MTFFGWLRPRHTAPHVNRTKPEVEVMKRRQYVEDRWRAEAFREQSREEDWERYYRERGDLVQGQLFGQ